MTLAAVPTSRRSTGLSQLWLVGAVFMGMGVGLAWMAYVLTRRGQ